MEKSLTSHYEQGIRTLDDLQVLADTEMSPLINRAYFHLSELKREADFEIGSVQSFSKINNFLTYYLESSLKKFFLDQEHVKQIIIDKDLSEFSFEGWDRLLEVLPASLFAASLFNFFGSLEIHISKNRMTFQGQIEEDYQIQDYRKQFYALTRKLLKSHSLMTFSLGESDKKGRYSLSLDIHIGHNENEVFGVDLVDERGILLGFSPIFEDFRITSEEAKNLDRHFCVEITKDLEIQKHYRVPERFCRENQECEIMHFPFLFRPVSIIIPKRGKTITQSVLRHLGDTGSGDSSTKQDVGKFRSYHYRYIDFFSLIV